MRFQLKTTDEMQDAKTATEEENKRLRREVALYHEKEAQCVPTPARTLGAGPASSPPGSRSPRPHHRVTGTHVVGIARHARSAS